MNERQVIRVRYWAAARAAAGVAEEEYDAGAVSLRALLDLVAQRHGAGTLPGVLAVCSVLVGERPASSSDPADVVVNPGDVVEFLPPFAGG